MSNGNSRVVTVPGTEGRKKQQQWNSSQKCCKRHIGNRVSWHSQHWLLLDCWACLKLDRAVWSIQEKCSPIVLRPDGKQAGKQVSRCHGEGSLARVQPSVGAAGPCAVNQYIIATVVSLEKWVGVTLQTAPRGREREREGISQGERRAAEAMNVQRRPISSRPSRLDNKRKVREYK